MVVHSKDEESGFVTNHKNVPCCCCLFAGRDALKKPELLRDEMRFYHAEGVGMTE